MSENRRRREYATEIVTQSTVLGIIGAQNRDSETVENHTRQIESLKKEIEERDNTLSRLNKELKDLQAQNDDLQITLESRNQEIEALKDKVDKLETERKILEKKLQYFELEFKDLKIQNDEKNKEIRELKISLESKDNEITAMKRELKDLKDQNDERAKEIKSKDKEIIALKDKIRGLENALKSLELFTEALKKECEDAWEACKKSEKDRKEMKLTIEKLSKNIQRMTKERDQKEKDDLKWRKEFQESMQRVQSYGRGSQSLPDPAENAFILLGQMCSRVQAMMYQRVLPHLYNEEYLYKLKFLEQDIERQQGDLKRQAIERWDELKRKLSWDDIDHPRTLKEIQSKRNDVAHPNLLTKELLYNSAEMMQEAGKLSGRMTLTRVRQIIKIWDLLDQME
ncbi:ERC protein 2-like [Pocillopora verrucosa]|uniref:ERC protein 2-like n=1 Tax=Pocillopora verrucosa TaxID=203993 RepID=UPI00334299FB